jgi:hypothetical protein
MSYQRPRKCTICGNLMTMQLTNASHIEMLCTHPHTVAMIEEFKARNRPLSSDDGDNNEGTKGSNQHG